MNFDLAAPATPFSGREELSTPAHIVVEFSYDVIPPAILLYRTPLDNQEFHLPPNITESTDPVAKVMGWVLKSVSPDPSKPDSVDCLRLWADKRTLALLISGGTRKRGEWWFKQHHEILDSGLNARLDARGV